MAKLLVMKEQVVTQHPPLRSRQEALARLNLVLLTVQLQSETSDYSSQSLCHSQASKSSIKFFANELKYWLPRNAMPVATIPFVGQMWMAQFSHNMTDPAWVPVPGVWFARQTCIESNNQP